MITLTVEEVRSGANGLPPFAIPTSEDDVKITGVEGYIQNLGNSVLYCKDLGDVKGGEPRLVKLAAGVQIALDSATDLLFEKQSYNARVSV
jgi:hypothetical protein